MIADVRRDAQGSASLGQGPLAASSECSCLVEGKLLSRDLEEAAQAVSYWTHTRPNGGVSHLTEEGVSGPSHRHPARTRSRHGRCRSMPSLPCGGGEAAVCSTVTQSS